MKKIHLTIAILISGGGFIIAQKISAANTPAAITAAFAKQFPGITVSWEKEQGKFEASFKKDGKAMSALFESNGSLLETEIAISTTALPATALQYIKKHFKGKNIREAAKITKADGTINFEAEINGRDQLFDAQGNFLKATKN